MVQNKQPATINILFTQIGKSNNILDMYILILYNHTMEEKFVNVITFEFAHSLKTNHITHGFLKIMIHM